MGPQNALIGDQDFGTTLPKTQVEEQDLAAERKAAKFSKTKEFKELKAHIEQRIAFYQTQLPNGDPVVKATTTDWVVANLVIAEFKAIIDAYERAAEAVKNTQ